jgi:hypothetical protein
MTFYIPLSIENELSKNININAAIITITIIDNHEVEILPIAELAFIACVIDVSGNCIVFAFNLCIKIYENPYKI